LSKSVFVGVAIDLRAARAMISILVSAEDRNR
jgi:hypothetical protein